MARPAEKARSMLNKWVAMQQQRPARSSSSKRPHLAQDCEHLNDAERFRNQIVREMAQQIDKIQNPALSEHELKDLNDGINQKMREKWHWNKRIRQLGGPDYNQIERERQIEENDPQRNMSYRYYGAAKDLPGVKELIEKQSQTKTKRSDVFLTPDYFGWRDEEDGVLLEVEHDNKRPRLDESLMDQMASDYLNVPNQDEIEQALLEHRKKLLLAKLSL